MHVALVTETYPPEVNGVAATVSRVVEGLRARGHTLQLLRPRQSAGDVAAVGACFAEQLLPGLPIPRYPQLRLGLPARATLVRAWTARRPDLVHIVTEGPLGWSALRAAEQLRLPVVTDFRTNFHAYCQHYGMAWLYDPITAYLRQFHNRAACTMVPTEGLRQELEAIGFQRLRVVSRGVDTQLFDPRRRDLDLRRQWVAGPADTVVMCVGRLAPEKNLGTLLTAFQALRRIEPGARLVLVGDGPQRAALQRRCPEAVFAGVRRGVELAAHYASADVFLFPSTTETFGNVVPEAMASGLAVVAFDHAAAAQMIRHGENGLLASLGDTDGFIAAAQRLATVSERARSMGMQARHTACQLSWGRVVQAVEAEYQTALGDPGVVFGPAWRATATVT